jgi:hypothetical protein
MSDKLNLNLNIDSMMESHRRWSRALQPMSDGMKLQRLVFEAAVALVDFERLPLTRDGVWADQHHGVVDALSAAVNEWQQWRNDNPGQLGARRHTLNEALTLAGVDRAELGDNVESHGDQEISQQDGHRVFEVAARKHLDMSSEEFISGWNGNRIDYRDPRVLQVARLLKYAR